MNLGEKMEKLRKLKKLTQDDFAQKLNELTGNQFKRTTISNYENNTSSPSVLLLPHIAKILGVSLDELFNFEEEPKPYKENNLGVTTIHEDDARGLVAELLKQNEALRKVVEQHSDSSRISTKYIAELERQIDELKKRSHVGKEKGN
jgi:transcriptional regulator with XRE-family HTH domain